MHKIKKGDLVTKKISNDKDNLVYYVENIIKSQNNHRNIAILKGITYRIETSFNIEDLEIVNEDIANRELERFENSIDKEIDDRIKNKNVDFDSRKFIINNHKSTILHLDGDKNYALKSSKVYDKFGLNAVVKNIKENKQPFEIRNLLNRYKPDIVIITGHDGMIKKGYNYNDLTNYRNSKYFIRTVEEARKWEGNSDNLAIFAGACQSYYEAIIEAGANFASSPARILIDFMDPLIIAQKVANTSYSKYITMKDIRDELRNGERGVSGIGSYGKLI